MKTIGRCMMKGYFMISFFVCLAILIGGYFIYGSIVSKISGPDDRVPPAVSMEDGVDYVVMPTWRIFLIQLLNIAGLGPIWGAIGGAMWGPSVFLWITFGTIFAGGVHDFASGFMSMRHQGLSVPELNGMYMGNKMKQVMRVFSTVLLFMVGVVFAVGPAGLLSYLFGQGSSSGIFTNKYFRLTIVFISKNAAKTVAMGLKDYVGAFGNVDWGLIFAAIGVSILPPMIVYFLLNRHVTAGMTVGATKG